MSVLQRETWVEALRTLSVRKSTEPHRGLKNLIGRITLCDGAFTSRNRINVRYVRLISREGYENFKTWTAIVTPKRKRKLL